MQLTVQIFIFNCNSGYVRVQLPSVLLSGFQAIIIKYVKYAKKH